MRGETELAWFKSSYSGGEGDSCVEVVVTQQTVRVRDSKDVTRPALAVGREEWMSFLGFASGR
ncbi:DUF397 domain-containing protein [Streptomyces xinghaiensis]|uniref:DUF397 domain-containing protein n=1 Tax=Streptomyces xinghaiensis TaxID=1038928 RepID=UPI000593C5F9|nr:DUF397 domain-containing protein [Streptomyces xinghaiensis]MZE80071.1 DUF397 domain-containing protein [Streptomyces sp. SID5475]